MTKRLGKLAEGTPDIKDNMHEWIDQLRVVQIPSRGGSTNICTISNGPSPPAEIETKILLHGRPGKLMVYIGEPEGRTSNERMRT